jgi:hypothetical protein
VAEISMLYGYMYLNNAWRIILANDINMNTELEALKDRAMEYVFHVNPNQQTINTTNSTLVKFYPQVLSSTHIIVGFLLNVNIPSTTEIKVQIKYDGLTVYELIQTVEAGWRTVSFPYIIPSVGTGNHAIEILAMMGSGEVVIEPAKLNVFLQAQGLLGASSLPPSVNILEEVLYERINNDKVNTSVDVQLQTNVDIPITQAVNYTPINDNKVSTSITLELL